MCTCALGGQSDVRFPGAGVTEDVSCLMWVVEIELQFPLEI